MATRNSSAGKNGALDPALPQKKRARRRLVGAAAVCLVAAIVLPIVLDSEPRQARDDVQVRIPSRETPLRDADDGAVQGVIGGATRAPAGSAHAGDAHAGASSSEADGPAEPLTEAPGDLPSDARESAEPAARPPGKTAAGGAAASAKPSDGAPPSLSVPASGATQAAAQPKAKTEPRTETKAEPKAELKAEARPELRPEPKPADARGGFLLQAGAFASEKSAAEQLARVRKTGQKAYTEKVSTSQGERIRVRIGPFASRDAAEKARAALKGAGVESALIAP